MNAQIAAFLRRMRFLQSMPGKMPGNLYVEAATLGSDFGTQAAIYQKQTGFLGQAGSYGGAPWQPDSVDREVEFIRTGRIF